MADALTSNRFSGRGASRLPLLAGADVTRCCISACCIGITVWAKRREIVLCIKMFGRYILMYGTNYLEYRRSAPSQAQVHRRQEGYHAGYAGESTAAPGPVSSGKRSAVRIQVRRVGVPAGPRCGYLRSQFTLRPSGREIATASDRHEHTGLRATGCVAGARKGQWPPERAGDRIRTMGDSLALSVRVPEGHYAPTLSPSPHSGSAGACRARRASQRTIRGPSSGNT